MALLRFLSRLVVPDACPACGVGMGVADLCPACACRAGPPLVRRIRDPNGEMELRAVAAFPYAGPGGALVRAMKYGRYPALADAAGHRAASAWRVLLGAPLPPADAVWPVPPSPSRLRARGYDPVALSARAYARVLGLPVARGLVRRRDPPPQAGLSRAERWGNVRGAFAARRSGLGLRVILYDDVATSGATLLEAARAARGAGAEVVGAALVATTRPRALISTGGSIRSPSWPAKKEGVRFCPSPKSNRSPPPPRLGWKAGRFGVLSS